MTRLYLVSVPLHFPTGYSPSVLRLNSFSHPTHLSNSGDKNRPLDTILFANIIIDGGEGSHDILSVNDQGSKVSKEIEVRATTVTGIYGSNGEYISYFDLETIDVAFGPASTQANVYSTSKDTSLTLRTQDGDDTFNIQNVQGPIKISSGCGNDYFYIRKTLGDIHLTSGAGLHSKTNVTIQDTSGGVDIDFGPAKSHSLSLSNTRGNVYIDTGFRVEESFITIEEVAGDVDVKVGSGDMHMISLSHLIGDTKLDVDLGNKIINTYNITGSFTADLTKGDDLVSIGKAEGEIRIRSGDGLHEYKLNETSGVIDIGVGHSNWLHHLFDLTRVDGSVKISAEYGDTTINGYEMSGSLSGYLGNGDSDITLMNAAVDVDLTTGEGSRNIAAERTLSFRSLFGKGDDRIKLTDTGPIHVESGDGLHELTFLRVAGNIEVDVGNAVGRGRSQLLTITETMAGNITLNVGNGNHRIKTVNTTNGEISIKTGKSLGESIIEVRDTTNGDVSVRAGINRVLDIVDTEGGGTFHGNVVIAIDDGPSMVNVDNASGDVEVDLRGSGTDTVTLLNIGGNTDVKTWDDNDEININKISGSLFISGGAGDDKIEIDKLKGNGTVLGGTGDDLLLLDPRGGVDNTLNTMDGSHLDWNGGGESADRIELYVVHTGTISFTFYDTGFDQIITRCMDNSAALNPSFSLGRQSQYLHNRLNGYLLIDIKDCCEAREYIFPFTVMHPRFYEC